MYVAPSSVRASARSSGYHGLKALSRLFKCKCGIFDRKAHLRRLSRAHEYFSSTSGVESPSSYFYALGRLVPYNEEECSYSSEVEDSDSSVKLSDRLLGDVSDDDSSLTSSLILRISFSVSLCA
ncbi:hypothetical protein SprV_0100016700 [Sparganum proliferum]